MSRRPKLDISAVNKVDAVPLRKAIELHEKALSEIEKAKARKADLEKEVAEWMENTDPDDTERINIIAGRKIQAEVLPGLIRRMENRIDTDLSPRLRTEAEAFKMRLLGFYGAASKAVREQVAEVLRPYFTIRSKSYSGAEGGDYASDLARRSDDCFVIDQRMDEAGRVFLPDTSRPGDAEMAARYDQNLIRLSRSLLAIAERP